MKLFQKFDEKNNGYLTEEEFVKGWVDVAHEPGNENILIKMRSIAEEQYSSVVF